MTKPRQHVWHARLIHLGTLACPTPNQRHQVGKMEHEHGLLAEATNLRMCRASSLHAVALHVACSCTPPRAHVVSSMIALQRAVALRMHGVCFDYCNHKTFHRPGLLEHPRSACVVPPPPPPPPPPAPGAYWPSCGSWTRLLMFAHGGHVASAQRCVSRAMAAMDL